MDDQTQAPIVLGYWSIRGLAQHIRYLLEYLQVSYTDKLYTQGDGPAFSIQEWTSDIPNLGMRFYNLPFFFDGNLKFSESGAITRYICKKWGADLLGKSDQDFAVVEQMYGFLSDIKSQITTCCYGYADVKKLKNSINPEIEAVVDHLEGKQFVVGDYITHVDFFLYELNELLEYVTKDHFTNFPKLKEYNSRIASLDRIEAYLKSDKFGKWPFNNKSAKI